MIDTAENVPLKGYSAASLQKSRTTTRRLLSTSRSSWLRQMDRRPPLPSEVDKPKKNIENHWKKHERAQTHSTLCIQRHRRWMQAEPDSGCMSRGHTARHTPEFSKSIYGVQVNSQWKITAHTGRARKKSTSRIGPTAGVQLNFKLVYGVINNIPKYFVLTYNWILKPIYGVQLNTERNPQRIPAEPGKKNQNPESGRCLLVGYNWILKWLYGV